MDYPLINGQRHDWSSVGLKIASKVFTGVKGISYDHSLDPGEVMGTRSQVIGVTRGQYKASGSVELYKAEYIDLITQLGGPGGILGYFERMFTVVVQYAATGLPVITDTLNGVRLKKSANDHSNNNDALTVKCDLYIMYVLENGLSPIGADQFLR